MKLSVKILYGLLAFLPLATVIIFLGSFIYLIQTNEKEFFDYLIDHPGIVTIFNLLILIPAYGPIILYIIHAARNPDLADRKPAWIILIVLLGGLAMPFYWYKFIWQDGYYE